LNWARATRPALLRVLRLVRSLLMFFMPISDRATQSLNQILTHNFHQNRIPRFISVGDSVLCYSSKSFNKRAFYKEHTVQAIPDHRAYLVVKRRALEIKFAPENVLLLPNSSLASTITQQRAGLHRNSPPADSSPALIREDMQTAVLGFSSDNVVTPVLDVPLVGLLDDDDISNDDV
jgi:hypothetical protein